MPPQKSKARAKRPKRNWVNLKFRAGLALGGLANDTAIKQAIIDLVDDFYCYSAQAVWTLRDLAPGQGPIDVGFCDGNYTTLQILEALDASPVGKSDKISLEKTKRDIRPVGSFPGTTESEALKNGETVYRKLLFPISSSSIFECYAVNRSGAVLTTGSVVHVAGNLTGWWL